jgi:hypothetical protein
MKKTTFHKKALNAALAAVLSACVLLAAIPAAHATSCPCTCVQQEHEQTRKVIRQSHYQTRKFIKDQFQAHEIWFLDTFFRQYILPAMMMMTENLTANGMHQMLIAGTFFDAKQQLETQRTMQEMTMDAYRKYQPSVELCAIGTMVGSLANAEPNGQVTASVLAKRSIERQLGFVRQSSDTGPVDDRKARLAQFIARYCDPRDSKGALEAMCPSGAPGGRRNKDINYTRTVDQVRTFDIDFTDGSAAPPDPTADEQDILALATNLYGSEVSRRFPLSVINVVASNDEYAELRSIIARRAVAEASFNAIVGMKAKSLPNKDGQPSRAAPYMKLLLSELFQKGKPGGIVAGGDGGITDDEYKALLGDSPSYYAQMEMLTQRIFQDPRFFTSLYDKPANIERKNVALQAIDLMLDRDQFKSDLRSEAMLSVILEGELDKYARGVRDRMGKIPNSRDSCIFNPKPDGCPP